MQSQYQTESPQPQKTNLAKKRWHVITKDVAILVHLWAILTCIEIDFQTSLKKTTRLPSCDPMPNAAHKDMAATIS